MAIARVSSCRSRTTETVILPNLTRWYQKVGESGPRKSTASSEEKRNDNGVKKKIRASGEQQQTGTCDTSEQEKPIKTIPRKRMIDFFLLVATTAKEFNNKAVTATDTATDTNTNTDDNTIIPN